MERRGAICALLVVAVASASTAWADSFSTFGPDRTIGFREVTNATELVAPQPLGANITIVSVANGGKKFADMVASGKSAR